MRRAILTIGGTVAGLAALLSFKTHSAADVSAAAAPSASPSPTLAAGSGTAGGTSGTKGTGSTKSAGSTSGTKGTGGAGGASGTGAATTTARMVTGKVDNTQYGPMQIQLVLTGKTITKVNVLQQTDTGVTSQQIDANAIPKLTAETLTAQSARIDAVSGASYTSMGYITSLQSAVDQAGI